MNIADDAATIPHEVAFTSQTEIFRYNQNTLLQAE
jgi:hypothetical protein